MSNSYFKKSAYIVLFFVVIMVNAQETKNKKQNTKLIELIAKEKAEINTLYELLNNRKRQEAYKNAHIMLKKIKAKESIVRMDLFFANYFNREAILDSTLHYANRALKNSSYIINDTLRSNVHATSYNLIGLCNNKRGLMEASKKAHLKGIESVDKYEKSFSYYVNLHGLANVYMKQGDHINALKYFKQCLEYKSEDEIGEIAIGSYINIGTIYGVQKKFESSNLYLKKANQICKDTDNKDCQAITAINIGSNYQDLGDYDQAMKYYKESLIIAKENQLFQTQVYVNEYIGHLLYTQKNYTDSKLYYLNALTLSIKHNFLSNQKDIYMRLKDIAVKEGDYKNAYALIDRYSQTQDSIITLEKDKEINELDIKFKTLQKENEIKDLVFENNNKFLQLKNQEKAIENLNLQKTIEGKKNENSLLRLRESSQNKANQIKLLKKEQQLKDSEIQRQKETRKIIFIGFIIILIPVIALLIVYYQKQKAQILINTKQKEISEQKNKSLLKEQELELIKAQVEGQDKERLRIAQELHDSIGGNLAAIKLQLSNSDFGKEREIKNINNQINDTYNQVRSLSHNMLPKRFNQNKFCDVLEDYQKKLAEVSKLTASFSAYPRKDIDHLNEKIQVEIYTIVQELITNTIKHAYAKKIELQLNLIQNSLNIMFEDDGIGFNTKNNKEGIGFINIKNRINSLKGTINIDSSLSRGSIFNIEIPIS
ncbi:tetratricopeptide repeat-containing sensor histidine kinase [Flavobacterium sp.]|uniref:tetratricopeptide repeat-containing sensor histidine kinase n=1 Tax=Flavobacterium sp. TaxID=239 RepID=UPI0040488712